MGVVNVHVVDSAFAHAPGLTWYNIPKHIKWVRGYTGWVPIRFFTDQQIWQVDNYSADINVALLVEPQQIDETGYIAVRAKIDKFRYVLTHDWEFKNSNPNGLIYKVGGCWIKPADFWGKNDTREKLVSIIASAKKQTFGHQLRHRIISSFPAIPKFGLGYNPVDSKATALKPFAFSIIVENCRISDYFTEKIIDCFMCGTVPIYWGSPDIGKTFNPDGIILFNDLEDIGPILETLSIDRWHSMQEAILDNFERASHYLTLDDELFTTFPFLFP